MAVLCLAVPGVLAQQPGPDGADSASVSDLRRCQDTLVPPNLPPLMVFQQAAPADTTPAIVEQVDLVAQRIAATVRAAIGGTGDLVPRADSLGAWAGAPVRLPIVMVLHRTQPSSWRIDSASDTVDAKLTALYAGALRTIPPDSLWMVWPDGYAPDSVAFRLLLHAALPHTRPASTHSAMFALYSTTHIVEMPAVVMENQPLPYYPDDAEKHQVLGEVLLAFVIGRDGRADASTIRVLQPTADKLRTSPFAHYYREFVNSATSAVRKFRFYPARKGTCTIRQAVQYPFSFTRPG
ncbi:MAG: hypothetical protein ACRENC_09205 [Gemmatimonadaceae bacterium]